MVAFFCWLRSAVRCLPFVSLLWLGACGEEAAPGLAKVVHGPGAGEWVDPLPVDGGPATVWIFVTVDCPIANAYAPEIGAIGLGGEEDLTRLSVGCRVEGVLRTSVHGQNTDTCKENP